jgi:hypothetical protein
MCRTSQLDLVTTGILRFISADYSLYYNVALCHSENCQFARNYLAIKLSAHLKKIAQELGKKINKGISDIIWIICKHK